MSICSSARILTLLIIILSINLARIRTDSSLCMKEQPPFEQFEPPIYTSSNLTFEMFVEKSGIFVDKTLFIEEILTNSRLRNRISFIYYPAGTGKSTNLNMLRTFLQPDLTAENVVKPYTKTWSYKFFTNGEIAKDHKFHRAPRISNYDYIVDKFLAKHPVVYIDFSIPMPRYITNDNFQEWFFSKVMDETYRSHTYLIEQITRTMGNQSLLYSERTQARDLMQQIDAVFSPDKRKEMIVLLCELLFKYYNQMAFVLINDYDRPLTSANNDAETDKDIEFIESFLNEFMRITFNDNKYISQAVIIGTDRLLGRKMLFGVHEYEEFHFESEKNIVLSNFFGFNKMELESLFTETKIPKDLQEEAYLSCFSYKNYRNKTFYNAPCIVKLVNTREIEQRVTASFDYDEFAKHLATARR